MLVIIIEVLAGLVVIIGWQTRLATLTLAGFSIVSALIYHANFADQMQFIMLMKNVVITSKFLLLIANGPGAYSLDNLLKPV